VSEPVGDGTDCTLDGFSGVCVSGVCGENLCEDVVCDDENACTDDRCDYVDGTCDYTPVEDGTTCSGGFCRDGACEILVDQCTANDLAAIEAGDEPDSEALADCTMGTPLEWVTCLNSISECLQDSGTVLSDECSSCFALQGCCALNWCSLLVGGPCTGPAQPGDACDMCMQEMCQPQVDVCIGGQ